MPSRRAYIEQVRRYIYGGMPDDDAEISVNLVNQWLDQAIGVAAKSNYTDNVKLDGISYTNNSFYTTFKGLAVEEDEMFVWKITLPHIPFGLGSSKGVSTLIFKDFESRQLSKPVVWLSQDQVSFYNDMRAIPNRILGYSQGEFIYVKSTLQLMDYTAQVTMVSGGNSQDLDSTLNVPADYIPAISEYLKQQLTFERMQPKDIAPGDGNDAVNFT